MGKFSQRIDRVLVLERHTGIREFLRSSLSELPGIKAIEFAVDCSSARDLLCETNHAVVVANPLLAPFGAFDVLESAKRSNPGFEHRLIAYSHDDPGRVIVEICRKTDSALVSGCAPVEELANAIQLALTDSNFFRRLHTRMRYAHEHSKIVSLTPRRLAVLLLIARGYSVKEASIELQITPKAVDSHLDRLRSGLKIRNRVDLAVFCRREGLLGTCDEAYFTHCRKCEAKISLGISQRLQAQNGRLQITCRECCDTRNCIPREVYKH